MCLKPGQLFVNTFTQEYYDDKAILDVYQQVVERLLVVLSEEEDKLRASESVTIQDSNVWPPWPWPPWDEDGDDEGGDKRPTNGTERAHKFARRILALEKRLAKASLDLSVLISFYSMLFSRSEQ